MEQRFEVQKLCVSLATANTETAFKYWTMKKVADFQHHDMKAALDPSCTVICGRTIATHLQQHLVQAVRSEMKSVGESTLAKLGLHQSSCHFSRHLAVPA